VLSSVAERHYGVMALSKFDKEKDAGRPKEWDSYESVYRTDKMTWFIKKHDDLQRDRAISFPFYRCFDLEADDDDYLVTEKLEMCSTDAAPVYPTRDVTKMCNLRVDLREVPKDRFKQVSGPNGKHLKLNYKLLVKIEGARMAFSFECGGKEYASVEAQF